jgi:hypothetical protein
MISKPLSFSAKKQRKARGPRKAKLQEKVQQPRASHATGRHPVDPNLDESYNSEEEEQVEEENPDPGEDDEAEQEVPPPPPPLRNRIHGPELEDGDENNDPFAELYVDEGLPLSHFYLRLGPPEVIPLNRKLKTIIINSMFQLRNCGDASLPIKVLSRLINQTVNEAKAAHGTPETIGVQAFFGSNIGNRQSASVWIRKRSPQFNTGEKIINEIEKKAQSNHNFGTYANQTVLIEVIMINPPTGAGAQEFIADPDEWSEAEASESEQESVNVRPKHPTREPQWYLNHGGSLVKIPKDVPDRWCLARALSVGFVAQQGKWMAMMKIDEDHELQGNEARKLLENAKISLDLPSYGIEQVKQIQRYYNERYPGTYRIGVIKKGSSITVLYRGPPAEVDIFVLLHNGHYDYINNPQKLSGENSCFCLDCGFSARDKGHHNAKCAGTCQQCMRFGFGFPCRRKSGEQLLTCPDCWLLFETPDCLHRHKIERTITKTINKKKVMAE